MALSPQSQFTSVIDFFGAPGRNNLEPSECELVLAELEEWTSILAAEPEVIHRLASLAEADQTASEASDETVSVGTSLEEPSP